MGVDKDILEQARASEVKAVMEVMKTLDPEPGEEPSSDLIFDACKDALQNNGLISFVKENQTVGITDKGQVLLSLMMARLEAALDFIVSLNMSAEDTTRTLEDISSLSGVGPAINRIMGHIGGGQPGLLINFFSFLVFRSILIANSLFADLNEMVGPESKSGPTRDDLVDFFNDDDGDGTIH